MSATTQDSLGALSEVRAVETPDLVVRSVEPEVREGPDGTSVYVLVRVDTPSGHGDWDLDAAYRLRQNIRRRAAVLGITEDVVVVLASADSSDTPRDEDDATGPEDGDAG